MVAVASPQHGGNWILNKSILRDKGGHCRSKTQPLKFHRINIVIFLFTESNNRDSLGSRDRGTGISARICGRL